MVFYAFTTKKRNIVGEQGDADISRFNGKDSDLNEAPPLYTCLDFGEKGYGSDVVTVASIHASSDRHLVVRNCSVLFNILEQLDIADVSDDLNEAREYMHDWCESYKRKHVQNRS
jgi:hypothetical protein